MINKYLISLLIVATVALGIFLIPKETLPTPTSDIIMNIPADIIPPTRLVIPRIKVEAAIEPVGVTSAGEMDVPKAIENVAWFANGTVPGLPGSAVVAGHYGWKNGKMSAFDDLHTLRAGDLLYVIDAQGATTTFAVREIKLYPFDANATEIFLSTDKKSHLNLVTCEGEWNAKLKTYSGRLVVFTDRVED